MMFALPGSGTVRDPKNALTAFWSMGSPRDGITSPQGMADAFVQAQRLQLSLFDNMLKLWLLPFTALEDAPKPMEPAVEAAEVESGEPAAPEPVAAQIAPRAIASVEPPSAAPAATPQEPSVSAPPAETAAPDAPALSSKSEDEPDDLERIVGIGPKLKQTLNQLGIWRFRQIADLSPAETAKLNDKIGFKGRIEREGWQAQASRLAKAARPARAA